MTKKSAMPQEVVSNCESIDASVFSGDMLWNAGIRVEFKAVCERWLRAVAEFEALEAEEVAGKAER